MAIHRRIQATLVFVAGIDRTRIIVIALRIVLSKYALAGVGIA